MTAQYLLWLLLVVLLFGVTGGFVFIAKFAAVLVAIGIINKLLTRKETK